MKYSQEFKLKLNICGIFCILLMFVIPYLLINHIILKLIPYLKKEMIILISGFLIGSILILFINYINNLYKLSKLGKEKIYNELDNNTQKVFKELGLYITKKYIVCLGSKINIFRLFVVPIDSIDAINTCLECRYFYKKKNSENKHKFLSFLKSSIQDKIMFGNSDIYVFNIICDKKVYSIATCQYFNKRKIYKIEKAANYICEKYENIDWI